jgi:periplasmic protein TonB
MNRTVALFEFMPYGAPELQSVARSYMVRALLAGTMLTALLFASFGLMLHLAGTVAVPPATMAISLSRPPVPAPIEVAPPAVPAAPALPQHVVAGVPLPTADERVAVETTIASADELRVAQPGAGTGDAPLVVEQPAVAETLPNVDEYVYVEEMPAVVHRVEPEYPSLAREAGVSGTVLMRLLVGRDGHVLDVKVDERHSIPMLDGAAEQAARQWVFTPAYANRRPVAVWVAVPFAFRLQ